MRHHHTLLPFLPLWLLPLVALGCVGSSEGSGGGSNDNNVATGGEGGSESSSGGSSGVELVTGGTSAAGGEVDGNPCDGDNPPDSCHMVATGPACGDGTLTPDTGEACDDGNALPGDGCDGICQVEPNYECPTPGEPCILLFRCGNGVIEPGEVCDDGNDADGDGCNSTCDVQNANYVCPTPGEPCRPIHVCGDSRVGGAETCDDGNATAGDGCDSECLVEPGYVCAQPGSACEPSPRCGDGIIQPYQGEVCDDANTTDGDGCGADCSYIDSGYVCPTPGEACHYLAECGDGVLFGDERCDDNNTNPGDGCTDCQIEAGYECPFVGAPCIPLCGDGLKLPTEACDDGNTDPDDGCDPTCRWEDGWACVGTPPDYSCHTTRCNDGNREGNEACDDGNDQIGDGCTPLCQIEPQCSGPHPCTSTCGDGLITAATGENCDDGNIVSGDGCSDACQVESGYECHQPPLPDTMTVPVTYRDFTESHQDFEPGALGEEEAVTGLVERLLNDEGNPVYRASTNYEYIGSAASFNDWYRDTSVSATIVDQMTLYANGNGGYVNRWGPNGEPWEGWDNIRWCSSSLGDNCATCSPALAANETCFDPCTPWGEGQTQQCAATALPYDGNPVFFPLDDNPDAITPASQYGTALIPPEYGGNWSEEPGGALHNFHFTSEVRYWFTYNADESYSLEFTGDDDVWVFVAWQLALDIGGIHTPQSDTLNINSTTAGTWGLEDGNVYEIVVFQAERQKDASTYKLTLTGFNPEPSECGPICGDGVIAPGEACDNGDNPGGYNECNPDCTRGEYCGDGTVQDEYEDCDNGLNVDAYGTTGCAPNCHAPPRCGDGEVQSQFGERCDAGENNVGGYGECEPDCQRGPRCGDGVLQDDWGEQCDDGNLDPGDGCSPICKLEGVCGDGVRQADEACDDGVNDGGYGECAPGCVPGPNCGDGVTQPEFEDCDGGPNATVAYGRCAPGCVLGPHCGDGLLQEGYEECDDAGTCSGGTVAGPCTSDDDCGGGTCQGTGNMLDGDGCSSACVIESYVPA